MKKQFFLTKSGNLIYANSLQTLNSTEITRETKLNDYFKVKEFSTNEEFIIYLPLLDFLLKIRKLINKPIRISSAYRSYEEQKNLFEKNITTAKNSTHTWGLAVDLDFNSTNEVLLMSELIKKIAEIENLKIRLIYKKYIEAKKTFIHLDLAPEIFAKFEVFHNLPHPPSWEEQIES